MESAEGDDGGGPCDVTRGCGDVDTAIPKIRGPDHPDNSKINKTALVYLDKEQIVVN